MGTTDRALPAAGISTATVDWQGGNGAWSAGGNWSGGVAPGVNDVAVIDSASRKPYIVEVKAPVVVGGLDLDAAKAVLRVDDTSLSCTAFSLTAGLLELKTATISGTVTAAAISTVDVHIVGENNIFDSLTWLGNLDVTGSTGIRHSVPELTIRGSLVLENAAGTGPGTANIGTVLIFSAVSELNEATINANGGLAFTNEQTLTIGASATVNTNLIQSASGTIVNFGTLSANNLSGTDVVNNNQLDFFGNIPFGAGVFNNGTLTATGTNCVFSSGLTNNGELTVASGDALALNPFQLPAMGSGSSLVVGSGSLLFYGAGFGTLATAQLSALYASDNIAAGSLAGFGLANADGGAILNNVGATLDLDAGVMFGTLSALGNGYIENGTVVYNGAAALGGTTSSQDYYTFETLALQSSAPTLTLGDIQLDDVNLTGPATLDWIYSNTAEQGTWTGVGTLNLMASAAQNGASYTISGVDITGVGNSGMVTVNLGENVSLDASQQDITGYVFNLAGSGLTFGGDGGFTANITGAGLTTTLQGGIAGAGALIAVSGGATVFADIAGNAGTITAAAGCTINLGNADFSNTGLIDVNGGTLIDTPTRLTNSGVIMITNGTLVLDGQSTLADFANIQTVNSSVLIGGTLSLSGATVTEGVGQTPSFGLQNGGTISDGTLDISAGLTFSMYGLSTIQANLINNGDVIVNNSASFNNPAQITGPIQGAGTISVEANSYLSVGAVSAGQTLAFLGSAANIELSVSSSSPSFSGTLSGFSAGDTLMLTSGNLYGAEFFGSSIFVEFDNGNSFLIATGSDQSGALITNNNTITFAGEQAVHLSTGHVFELPDMHGFAALPNPTW